MNYKYSYNNQLIFQKGFIVFFQLIILSIMIARIGLFFELLPKFLFFIICEFLMTLAAIFWTNIKTTKEGIQISFYFKKLQIPWFDIVDIESVRTSKLFFKKNYLWYIEANNLPIFYRFFGLFFVNKWTPCVIIIKGLENIDQLIEEIKSHKDVISPITS